MKLVVLAGAKTDTVVPLKKERFVIGRAKECALRAGSEAISRRHCEITRTAEGAHVSDLGSRNGTYVNDQKIDGETPLSHGDRVRVGPLEFRFEVEGKLNDIKHPKVKSATDAVARTADLAHESAGGHGLEENISDWLMEEPIKSPEQAIKETQTFSIDDTRALAEQFVEPDQEASEGETTAEEATDEDDDKKKKEPGKLPKDAFAKKQTKDSTEAAAQAIRDFARRR